MGLILCITHTSPFLCASRYALLRCVLPARSTSTKANILKFNSRPSLRFCIVSRCDKWLHAHWKRRNPLIQYASCEGYSVFPMCYYYEQYRRQLSSCSFQIFCSIICLLCCFYSYGTFFNTVMQTSSLVVWLASCFSTRVWTKISTNENMCERSGAKWPLWVTQVDTKHWWLVRFLSIVK